MGTNETLLWQDLAARITPQKWGQVNTCIMSDLSNARITPVSRTSSGTKVVILVLDPICNQEKLPLKWGQIIIN